MMKLLFLTLKILIPRDGSNGTDKFAPISSLSHLALVGGTPRFFLNN